MPNYKYTFDQVEAVSRGRVLEVLQYFSPGFDWDKARKSRNFCPVHTGKNGDAFRCLDLSKRGGPPFEDVPSMVCNTCHGMKPVSGIINCVMWLTGSQSKYDTLVEIANCLQLDPNSESKPPPKIKPKTYEKKEPKRNSYAAKKLKNAWKEALPISNPKAYKIIKTYLESRGLSVQPSPIMRLAPSLEYRYEYDYDEERKRTIYRSAGYFPAILTLMTTNVTAKPMNIHRTYLDPVTFCKLMIKHPRTGLTLDPKKVMSPVIDGQTVNSVMRLFNPVNGVIGIAEGIETCLAIYQATGLPMWSASNHYGLRYANFNSDIKVVLPFGDFDIPDDKGDRVGVISANTLAERMLEEGRQSEAFIPEFDLTGRDKGVDWLDMLNMFGVDPFPDVSHYLMAA